MKLDSNLGFVYISEQTTPEENIVRNLEVHDKNGVFYVDFESCLHSFDVMNRNSRMYKASNIDQCLKTERIQHYLSHGGWFGEQNHPISKYKDRPLSADRIRDIDMDNTSHKMLNPHIEKNLLVSRIQSDSGTSKGMNLARKMVQGFIPGFSCRAIAMMDLQNGKPVVNVRQLITYDWVLYQSHHEAEQIGNDTRFIIKNPEITALESTTNDDIMIPLADLMRDIGYSDPSSQMIMEHFDLNDDCFAGFSAGNNHLLMRDNDNVIYCNIDANSRAKVNDFLLSF